MGRLASEDRGSRFQWISASRTRPEDATEVARCGRLAAEGALGSATGGLPNGACVAFACVNSSTSPPAQARLAPAAYPHSHILSKLAQTGNEGPIQCRHPSGRCIVLSTTPFPSDPLCSRRDERGHFRRPLLPDRPPLPGSDTAAHRIWPAPGFLSLLFLFI